MMKKNNRKKPLIAIIILIIVVIAVIISYLLPTSPFGYRTLLYDSKTHTYNEGETFNYGPFRIKVTTERSKIECTTECSSSSPFRSMPSLCGNLSYCNEDDWLKINYSIYNTSNKIQSMGGDWFTYRYENGDSLQINAVLEFFDILPKTERKDEATTRIKKDEKNFVIIISIPNRSPQIIQITK